MSLGFVQKQWRLPPQAYYSNTSKKSQPDDFTDSTTDAHIMTVVQPSRDSTRFLMKRVSVSRAMKPITAYHEILHPLFVPLLYAYTYWGLFAAILQVESVPSDFSMIRDAIVRFAFPTLVAFMYGHAFDSDTSGIMCTVCVFGCICSTSTPMIVASLLTSTITLFTFKICVHLLNMCGFPLFFKELMLCLLRVCIVTATIFLSFVSFESLIPLVTESLANGVLALRKTWIPLLPILSTPSALLYLHEDITVEMHKIGCNDINGTMTEDMCEKGSGSTIAWLVAVPNIGSIVGTIAAVVVCTSGTVRLHASILLPLVFFGGIWELVIPIVFLFPQLIISLVASDAIGVLLIQSFNVSVDVPIKVPNVFTMASHTSNVGGLVGIVCICALVGASFSFATFFAFRCVKRCSFTCRK